MLVELVVGLKFPVDVVVVKQHAACPGVFSQDEISVLEYLDGPECHVVQVSDRGRDYVEDSGHDCRQLSLRRTAIISL